jgi:hypothetical protein
VGKVHTWVSPSNVQHIRIIRDTLIPSACTQYVISCTALLSIQADNKICSVKTYASQGMICMIFGVLCNTCMYHGHLRKYNYNLRIVLYVYVTSI